MLTTGTLKRGRKISVRVRTTWRCKRARVWAHACPCEPVRASWRKKSLRIYVECGQQSSILSTRTPRELCIKRQLLSGLCSRQVEKSENHLKNKQSNGTGKNISEVNRSSAFLDGKDDNSEGNVLMVRMAVQKVMS